MNPRHLSESTEHYTPSWIVELARGALGSIELDPASSEVANRTVRANRYFTEKDNGYLQSWDAETLFLNPPGGRCDRLGCRVVPTTGATPACATSGSCGLPPEHVHEGVGSAQKRWWERLSAEWWAGNVQHAVFVAFSVELLQVTQVDSPLESRIPLRFPILYPSRRVAYERLDGSVGRSPPHASAIVLLTWSWETLGRFEELARPHGELVIPHKWEVSASFK